MVFCQISVSGGGVPFFCPSPSPLERGARFDTGLGVLPFSFFRVGIWAIYQVFLACD
jgi:hypothetical protein